MVKIIFHVLMVASVICMGLMNVAEGAKAKKIGMPARAPSRKRDAGCSDNHQNCRGWAQVGECQANPGWMLKNCMKSCKVCKPAASGGGGSKSGGNIKDACLKSANDYRDLHRNTPHLQWDAELAAEAQKYAEELKRLAQSYRSVQLRHDPRNNAHEWGENLWYQNMPGSVGTCGDANKAWYAEIKDWDINGGRKKCGCVTEHFTSMVWRTTTKVGYGKVVFPSPDPYYGKNTVTIVVAKYTPRANWVRKSDYNKYVMPLA